MNTLMSSLILLLMAAECGLAQIGYPGQYPGGQYPGQYPQGGGGGIPFPIPGRRTRTNQDAQPTQNFVGTLRKISTNELTMDSDDRRSLTISLFSTTRYYKSERDADSGGSSRPPGNLKRTDFQEGDQVSVDVTQDDNGNYRAVKVALKDTANSSPTSTTSRRESSPSSTSSNSSGSDSSDDDRPKLKRAAPRDSSDAGLSNAASSGTPSNTASNPSTSNTDSSDRPVLRRPTTASSSTTSPSSSTSSSTTAVTPPPPPRDADDPGQPTLQRRAQPRASSSPSGSTSSNSTSSNSDSRPSTIADARPSLHAEDVNGVTRLPDAPVVVEGSPGRGRQYSQIGDEDPIIAQAREEAFSFSETLPNYVVKQFTTRYATGASRGGGRTSWQALDTVTADVVSEEGKESYRNVLINGKPTKEAIEKTGAWSTGEFSSMQQDILSPDTDADFHGKRTTSIVNRAAYRYDFTVEQRNSHWDVHAVSESYSPGYTGTIWVDKATSRILRIEIAAEKIPRGFPLDTVESAIDYDFVLIGDSKYLLPVHSEALSCRRGTSECTRNVIDFRNYKKFGAETNITFGQ